MVFLIAVGLIDVGGMRRILAVRKHEFAVALLTTAAVVVLGVEYGIVLAVIASIIDHLRHSYSPRNSVLVKSPAGHWQPAPIAPGARTEEGLVVYRFGTSLYYANAARLLDDITVLAGHGGPLRWMVFDCAAIGDVDYTASAVLPGSLNTFTTARPLRRQHRPRPGARAVRPLRHHRGPRPRRLLRHSR